MLKQNQEVDSPPNCFGKEFDAKSPECTGGHDPAFYNDNSASRHYGTQVRDTCDWVNSCSARMQATRNLIPVNGLVRPPLPQRPPNQPYSTHFQTPSQPPQQWRPPAGYTPPYNPAQYAPPQHPASHLMSTHFGIPQYLTTREPQTNGSSFGKRLFMESLRSMLKSIGHTFAHFFDTEVLGQGGPDDGRR